MAARYARIYSSARRLAEASGRDTHLFENGSDVESLVWLVGPFVVTLLAILVARRKGSGWTWAIVAPPYIAVAIYYKHADTVARAAGIRLVDGSPIDSTWNAGGVAILLGTVAHIATLRRWPILASVAVAGFAAMVPAVFGIMGAGIFYGVVGSLLVAALHTTSNRLMARS